MRQQTEKTEAHPLRTLFPLPFMFYKGGAASVLRKSRLTVEIPPPDIFSPKDIITIRMFPDAGSLPKFPAGLRNILTPFFFESAWVSPDPCGLFFGVK